MKNLQKRTFCYVSILFAVLIFIQHQYIFMYQDDYGYASLTYGITENKVGMSYSLVDIFKYLVWHYFNWGGRVLYFFFEITIFRIGGLKLMQLVQSIIIVLICIISGKIIANLKKTDSNTSIMLTLVFFGLFHQLTLMDGVYWYSASILYVWPLLPFFRSIYLFTILDEKENWFNKCMFILLIFFAVFSQEQIAVFVFMWIICILFFKKKNKEKVSWYIWGGVYRRNWMCIDFIGTGKFC